MADEHQDASVVMPLVLSLMAGLSTCLGAAVVFCAQRNDGEPPLSHHHLAFALSLAGSVMVTVSVASILPESFQDEENVDQFVEMGSRQFIERILGLSIGCVLYVMLSKCAFPEPDDILDLECREEEEEEGQELVSLHRAVSLGEVSVATSRSAASSSAFKRAVRSSGSSDPLASPPMSRNASMEDLDLPNLADDSKKEGGNVFFSGSDLSSVEARRNWRVAMLLFVSLAVHNFPGTFMRAELCILNATS